MDVMILLSSGSALIALLLTWQIKTVSADWAAITRYYVYTTPILLTANILIAIGFARAHAVTKNLAMTVAGQTLVYYIFLILFSAVLLGDNVSMPRAAIGVALIAAGAFVLRGT